MEALLQIHSCFFSQSRKQRVLPLSALTVSLHYLPTWQDVCVQQSHAAKRLLPQRSRSEILAIFAVFIAQ